MHEISDRKIELSCAFYHMNDHGVYDGWTAHRIVARCGFYLGITITVSGPNRDQIKEYLSETYALALALEIEWSEDKARYVRAGEP